MSRSTKVYAATVLALVAFFCVARLLFLSTRPDQPAVFVVVAALSGAAAVALWWSSRGRSSQAR